MNWSERHTTPSGEWQDVVFAEGRFVAVSYGGTNQIMTSPDGVDWTARSAPEPNRWTGVAHGRGRFVAVAEDGPNRVMTSPDGVTWSANPGIGGDSGWSAIEFAEGRFVAVGYLGGTRVMTSLDGGDWAPRSAAAESAWSAVTYGDGQFVAVAFAGPRRVMTSPDGITWTARTAASEEDWFSVTHGDGLFVASHLEGLEPGDSVPVMTSSDGITWTSASASAGTTGLASWGALTHAGGMFVAVLRFSMPDGFNVMTSGSFSPPPAPVAPGAPSGLSATGGDGSAVVSFTAGSDGGASVDNYEYSLDGGPWRAFDPEVFAPPVTISGLENGRTYGVRLRAVNFVGDGAASGSVSVTPTAPPRPPAPPVPPSPPPPVPPPPAPTPDSQDVVSVLLARFDFGVGKDLREGDATVSAGGGNLLASSQWSVTLRSEPVVLGSGSTDAAGGFQATVTIPADTAAGGHSVTVAAVAADGREIMTQGWFSVDENGVVNGISIEGPIDVSAPFDGQTGSGGSVPFGGRRSAGTVDPVPGDERTRTRRPRVRWLTTMRLGSQRAVATITALVALLSVPGCTPGGPEPSTAGREWVEQVAPNNAWLGVTHGDGLFVAVGLRPGGR